jgi:hypothetical protein
LSPGFVARCRIGWGSGQLIADADWLNVDGEGEGQNLTCSLRAGDWEAR